LDNGGQRCYYRTSHNKKEEPCSTLVGHPDAWNLNPSFVKTIGKSKGQPIPRHLSGRADAIPLADGSVNRLIVERTPLQVAALQEIARVISSNGTIIEDEIADPRPGDIRVKIQAAGVSFADMLMREGIHPEAR
jgi:hypothetical protein